MAIYRAESNRRVVMIALVAVVVGLVVGLAIGRLTAPGLGAQIDDLRTQVAPIRSSLEVVSSEYPKLLAGGTDPGGTMAALAKIEATYAAAQPTLAVLNSKESATLNGTIMELRTTVEGKATQADVDAAIQDVTKALDALVQADSGTIG